MQAPRARMARARLGRPACARRGARAAQRGQQSLDLGDLGLLGGVEDAGYSLRA
jgi:hypothetical protein